MRLAPQFCYRWALVSATGLYRCRRHRRSAAGSVVSNALEREAAGFGSAETSRRNLAAITCARAAGVEKPLRSGCSPSLHRTELTLDCTKQSFALVAFPANVCEGRLTMKARPLRVRSLLKLSRPGQEMVLDVHVVPWSADVRGCESRRAPCGRVTILLSGQLQRSCT